MRNISGFLLVLVSFVLFSSSSFAEVSIKHFAQEGNEFWVCFTQNYRNIITPTDEAFQSDKFIKDHTPILKLFITSSNNAHVTVDMNNGKLRKDITVQARGLEIVELNTSALTLNEGKGFNGIHIKSDVPVYVSGLNTMKQTTDTYTALPVQSLGNEYMVMSYTNSDGLMSDFAIIATEDNTSIKIRLSAPTRDGKQPGEEVSVKLNRGGTYLVTAKELKENNIDLTGTIIKSDKKIAVFGCHQCAYVPEHMIACNHLTEQLLPLNLWGKTYIAGKIAMRANSSLRVLAYYDSTEIKINGKTIKILKAGEFYEDSKTNSDRLIESSKPVSTAMYSHGFRDGDSIGDPMMYMLRPTDIYLNYYRVTTPITGDWHHFINIIVPKEALRDLMIDDKNADEKLFTVVPGSDYVSGQIEISFGSHLFKCSKPFGISSYGFGYNENAYDAYGNF